MLSRLRPLFPYLRRYWRSFALGGLALIVYNAAKAMIPLLIGGATRDIQNGLSAAKVEHHAIRILAVAVVAAITLYLTRQIIIGASREIEFDLRNDLFSHLESQPPEFFQRHRTGDIMAHSTNDLNAVRQLLGPAIMYSANTIVFTAFALPFMLRISPRLTMFAFLPLPFASVLVQYFGARIHIRFERIQAMFSDISAQAEENFSAARLIRAFTQEEAQIAAFETSNQEYIRRSLLLARLMAMLWPTLEFVLGVSLVVTLLVGGHEVVAHRITVDQFFTYNIFMVQLTWPMIAIGWVVNLVQRGTASVTRIHNLMTEMPTITDAQADPALVAATNNLSSFAPNNLSSAPNNLSPLGPDKLSSFAEGGGSASPTGDTHRLGGNQVPQGFSLGFHTPVERGGALAPALITGHITFDHLSFTYPTGPEVLHDITLDIPAGSSLAIVGPTGSGKSTLVSLIPRLYDAPHNSVLLDDRPLRDYPLQTLRASIGFVPQETFLFSTTIANNIAFGVPAATTDAAKQILNEQIEAAARTAHIADEILEFPSGFRTIVGERGVTLSGGQKQRTAIARAILRNPPILILDDALASVDTYTEEQILAGLHEAMQGRTTILIAHRVSTARNADRIAVLIDGRIAELGTHDELIARNGYYTDLFEKQSLEEEILTA
ncbi:ABC transporter ATP-binding protein [Granulicella sp. L46]|uniref:ABC transporter ATP-binding protein n=1 Tax=Granulicella sp. L46 TaxID=1641865 RepID=UPI0020B11B1A|nr:ABC transporter ATP-binding protein [Granulicella sp. L46]